MSKLTAEQRKELLDEIDYNRKNCFLSSKTELLMQIAEAALTAPETNPIELPKSERLNGNGYGYYFDMNDVFVALDSAGAKYKVVK